MKETVILMEEQQGGDRPRMSTEVENILPVCY